MDFINKNVITGTEQNTIEAYKYYRKTCDLDHGDGCLFSGTMLTQEKKMELNFVEGLADLEKACSKNNTKACYFASGIYLSGVEGIPQNKTKARELSLSACNGGNIYACMNLCQMYRIGDGVEKDEKKANEFKERAKEIRNQHTKSKSIRLQEYT